MTSIGQTSFALFLLLIALTAAAFCLPYHYGWSWGVAIQLWALFGFIKLYHVSEPIRADAPHKKLSQRLRDSLFRRASRDNDVMIGRLGQGDSLLVMVAGALMIVCILSGAYDGMIDVTSLQRSLYVTLYLIAQVFCLGVIAFLAQVYAANNRFVLVGFFAGFALSLTVLVYALARYGVMAPMIENPNIVGTSTFIGNTEPLSAFNLRRMAMGWGGAILPWLVVMPMAFTLLRVLFQYQRSKLVPVLALLLVALVGFYDLFAVRGHFHFLVILPAWVAMTLAWGRSGYGPLWTPWAGFAAARASRALAKLR